MERIVLKRFIFAFILLFLTLSSLSFAKEACYDCHGQKGMPGFVDRSLFERPLEYRRLAEENRLEEVMTGPQKTWITDAGILFGFAVVLTGFILLVLILLGQFVY